MDVSEIIEAEAAKHSAVAVEKDSAVEIDAGLLTITDPNPIDPQSYLADKEAYLTELAREGVQLFLGKLFSLPTQSSPDGPLALLPKPTTQLPRAKPLPKPKPPTKWEQFSAAKGISKKIKDRKVWDEERQEWVNRWGVDGKNKDKEEQWIHELPDNADDDFNPAAAARAERKKRVAKNEKQKFANIARAQTSEQRERKAEIERTLLTTKTSTASMGKFDKKLEGEPKVRGVKRKFAPNEIPSEQEKKTSLAILSKLDSGTAKVGKKPKGDHASGADGDGAVLNVRKALRHASGGRGGAALGRELSRNNSSRGRAGGRGGRGGSTRRGKGRGK